MERSELAERFCSFLNTFYRKELSLAEVEEREFLLLDFAQLDKFDPELADLLLEEPEDVLRVMENTLKEFDLKQVRTIRFYNLPESCELRIRDLRVKHMGKFIVIEGIVKRASEVRPEIMEAIYTCGECGERFSILLNQRVRPIVRCSCGARRNVRLIDQKLSDARWICMEEPYELTAGERPSELVVYLKQDLTSPRMQSRTDPGNRIKVIGILKQLARKPPRGGTRQLEIYLDANYVESVEVGWEELEISKEDERAIKKLARDPKVFEKLVASFAPTLYGIDEIKEAIILQLFGGERHILPDGTRIRGNIHILLVGDPSSGKSQVLQLAAQLIPRGRYVSGRGLTAAGITATVIRDEQFGGWCLEAGALVMANKSVLGIDEFGKVSAADQVALQEAMSLGTISIAKASIVATLPADTAILAGANPKLGRFDPYIPIREQITISDVLLSRFDLKFALRDIPNPELDAKLTEHILKSRHFRIKEMARPLIDPKLLKKYIAYARARCHPKLTKEAGERIKEFYLKMRERAGEEAPIAITLRQYEALIRLAEAAARVRLSDKIEIQDAERAVKLMKVSLRQFGFEPETGEIDIDRAEGLKVTTAQRSKIRIILDLMDELSLAWGKDVPAEELTRSAKEAGIDNVDSIIRKMLREGIIFAPRPGVYRKV